MEHFSHPSTISWLYISIYCLPIIFVPYKTIFHTPILSLVISSLSVSLPSRFGKTFGNKIFNTSFIWLVRNIPCIQQKEHPQFGGFASPPTPILLLINTKEVRTRTLTTLLATRISTWLVLLVLSCLFASTTTRFICCCFSSYLKPITHY